MDLESSPFSTTLCNCNCVPPSKQQPWKRKKYYIQPQRELLAANRNLSLSYSQQTIESREQEKKNNKNSFQMIKLISTFFFSYLKRNQLKDERGKQTEIRSHVSHTRTNIQKKTGTEKTSSFLLVSTSLSLETNRLDSRSGESPKGVIRIE